MGVSTAAGTVLAIGTTASSPIGDTYAPIGEIVSIPEFGRVYNEVTHSPLGNRAVQKFKGSYNDGTLALQLGKDSLDAGQEDLLAALETDHDYNFKLTLNDTTPTEDIPTIIYFKAKVMGVTTNVGSLDQVVGSTVTLSIKSGSVNEVPRSADA